MAKAKEYPDINLLRSTFSVSDCGAGLIWAGNVPERFIGKPVAVTITQKGYARIMMKGRALFLHRVLWKMHYGKDPENQIDHIDGNRLNNKIENLRDVSHSQNVRNCRPRGGASRFKGVYAAKRGRWGARIKVGGQTIHLGTYDTEVEAAEAYDRASVTHHGENGLTNAMAGLL